MGLGMGGQGVSNKEECGANGISEGIARALSQACVYYLDTRKILLQAQCGKASVPMGNFLLGMLASASTSGVVFLGYFSVYNNLRHHTPLAGPIAALASSFIKIPISNIMRVIQRDAPTKSPCFMRATNSILKRRGVLGLYNGYFLSLAEDVIELDMRIKIYEKLSPHMSPFLAGSLAGFIVSYVTTPFDTAKTCLAIGIPITPYGLYNGAFYRASSNAVKFALFFGILDQIHERQQQSRG